MNPIFLTAGIGSWYATGAQRFCQSLQDHGWRGDVNAWIDEWPSEWTGPRDPIYCIKAAAFERVMNLGYTTILWADASVTAIRSITPLLEQIEKTGYWLGQSGYNCAEVCPDAMLAYFGVNRDDAERVPDCATGLFGLDLTSTASRRFLERWIRAARDGAFSGSRFHAGQSTDPRFKFGRQDQSAASLIAGQLGMSLEPFQARVKFKWDEDAGQIFHCEGM